MPRYDDRYANTRLYVGRLSSRTRSRDLEHLFSRYGRVRAVDMKHDFAFVDFSDPRDADDARYRLHGRDFCGSRLIVEFAKGGTRGSGSSRDFLGRGPPPGSGRCFNCGLDGHWARDCKAGDWKNKCYRCGERGHIERNCQNSPKKLIHVRSYSRSPMRSLSPHRGRNRSPSYSRSRSYSHSKSPPKREQVVELGKRRARGPRYSRSPEPRNTQPPSRARKRSPTPDDEGSPRERGSLSPKRSRLSTERDGSKYSESPREKSRSPVSPESESPHAKRNQSPSEDNDDSRSPSPKDNRSPVDDDDDDDEDDNGHSPRHTESS